MYLHQLPRSLDVPLFERLRVADELFGDLLCFDDQPHAPVRRDVLSQRRICHTHRVDLSAFRASEEGELDLILHVGFRGHCAGHSPALIALDLRALLLFLGIKIPRRLLHLQGDGIWYSYFCPLTLSVISFTR